jgi:hypothetical protein
MYRINLRSQHTTSKFLAALATLLVVASLASDVDAAAPRKLSPPNFDSGYATRIGTPANQANARAVFLARQRSSALATISGRYYGGEFSKRYTINKADDGWRVTM